MRVLVETNFLLEYAFEQEESADCDGVLGLAGAGRIELALPVFSVLEARMAVDRRAVEWNQQRDALRNGILREGTRMGSLQGGAAAVRKDFDAMIDLYLAEASRRLDRITERVLRVGAALPMQPSTLAMARELRDEFGLKGPDTVVLATVLESLAEKRAPAIFINRNSNDFDTRAIRERLTHLACDLAFSFRRAHQRLLHTTAAAGG